MFRRVSYSQLVYKWLLEMIPNRRSWLYWVFKNLEIRRSPRRQSTGRLFGPVTFVLCRFENFNLTCIQKIFAFSTQTGQSNFVHRKIFIPFQTQIKQSNFLCEWRYWKNDVAYDIGTFFFGRTNVPTGFFVTGSLLDRRHQPCICLINLAFASIASTVMIEV